MFTYCHVTCHVTCQGRGRAGPVDGTEQATRSGPEGKDSPCAVVIWLSATLRITFVGFFPFLAYDKGVFLELLSRLKAQGVLVLDTLARSTLVCEQGSEPWNIETRYKNKHEIQENYSSFVELIS